MGTVFLFVFIDLKQQNKNWKYFKKKKKNPSAPKDRTRRVANLFEVPLDDVKHELTSFFSRLRKKICHHL
jgi:hypothetical protein